MRCLIVGLGNQGRKRLAIAGGDCVATVDPIAPDATYSALEDAPLASFDAALVCTPDDAKLPILQHLLRHRKHILVEKPLLGSAAELQELKHLAVQSRVACYTAYNHRFEPHVLRLKQVLDDAALGDIYLARLHYGNGTARNVNGSSWRDRGLGVLGDLGSHLLDLVLFLFGDAMREFTPWSGTCFENRAFDHCLFGTAEKPVLALEASLVSWRNSFTIDVYGSAGSAHIDGLCKWGPSRFIVRRRVFPSGKPPEQTEMVKGPDPTWALEYEHFKGLCRTAGNNIDHDLWIGRAINGLAASMEASVAA